MVVLGGGRGASCIGRETVIGRSRAILEQISQSRPMKRPYLGLVDGLRGGHPTKKLLYKGTWLIRKRTPLGSYSRTMPRGLWWSQGVGGFL